VSPPLDSATAVMFQDSFRNIGEPSASAASRTGSLGSASKGGAISIRCSQSWEAPKQTTAGNLDAGRLGSGIMAIGDETCSVEN